MGCSAAISALGANSETGLNRFAIASGALLMCGAASRTTEGTVERRRPAAALLRLVSRGTQQRQRAMDGRRGAPACSLLAAALASAPRGARGAEGTGAEDAASLRRKYALASRTLTAQTRMVEQLREALRTRDAEVEAERVRCSAAALWRMRLCGRCAPVAATLTLRRAARVAGGAGGAARARVRAASFAGAAGGEAPGGPA